MYRETSMSRPVLHLTLSLATHRLCQHLGNTSAYVEALGYANSLRPLPSSPVLSLEADVNIRCYLDKSHYGRKIAEVTKNPYAATPKRMDIRMNVHER